MKSRAARHGETSPRTQAARGEDRRALIVAAATRLFAERGFSNVSVRDIAAEAGVTHPLIYYYWGSKAGLLAAILERSQSRVREASRHTADALEAVLEIARESLEHNREYLLTLTRALLDGVPPADWPGGFPGIESAIDLLVDDARWHGRGAAADDIRLRVASATAMLNGWVLIEDQLLEIVGLPECDRDQARETLVESIRRVLEPAVRRPGGNGRGA